LARQSVLMGSEDSLRFQTRRNWIAKLLCWNAVGLSETC